MSVSQKRSSSCLTWWRSPRGSNVVLCSNKCVNGTFISFTHPLVLRSICLRHVLFEGVALLGGHVTPLNYFCTFFLWCVNCCNQTSPFGREIDSLWRSPRCISQHTVWDGKFFITQNRKRALFFFSFFLIQTFCRWLMMKFEKYEKTTKKKTNFQYRELDDKCDFSNTIPLGLTRQMPPIIFPMPPFLFTLTSLYIYIHPATF